MMNNRPATTPIFFTAILVSGLAASAVSHAEPGVPSDDSSSAAPPVVTAPAPAPAPTSDTGAIPPPVAATPTPESAAPESPVPTAAATTPSPAPAKTSLTTTYTVKRGDSLRSIADKAGCTVAELKKLNHLTKKSVRKGQVLEIPTSVAKAKRKPSGSVASDASAKPKKSSHRKADAEAQPVQDFDIPASNFASCPVPEPSPENDPSAAAVATTPEADETSAPVAQLVSPEELAADAAAKAASTEAAPKPIRTAAVTPAVLPVAPVKKPSAPVAPVPDGLAANPYNFNHSDNAPDQSAAMASAPSNFASSSSKQENRGYEPASSPASNGEWNDRLMQQARWLGDMGLTYDEDWRPPGESRAWTMDCSNTTRYLYKVTAGINLPRTASDQYYFLHLQGKAWDVPQASNGYADCNYLRSNLKVGDLLFWENTYRPERQPPITHVMIFLGTNERGEWIMVGSQSSRGGLHNRRHGGPDIYVFDPTQPCGGYTTWFGFVHHQGRFCAYGRPLEADPSKLTVATND